MPRLFFALWPDPGTREKLALVGKNSGLIPEHVVPAQNLHITIAFLGNIAATRVEPLINAMSAISVRRFLLEINRSGWWVRPQIVWLGPEVVPEQLTQLWADIHKLVRERQIPVEARPYRPHITLARKIRADIPLEYAPIHWNVRDFCLVESVTRAEGAEYKIIQHWALTSA